MQMDRSDGNPGLQVLVVGGSIGGLSTAIALKAQGHCVKIFEQATSDDIKGAGVTIFPNALGAVRSLGVDPSNIRATKVKKITRVQVDPTGEGTEALDIKLDEDSCFWHNTTYSDLLQALRVSLQDPKSPGPKAEIYTSQQIVRIDPTNGILFFGDGSQARGHIIIGADGVHSICRSFVPRGKTQRFRIERGVFRALIPREKLIEEPKTSKFIQNSGQAFCYNLGSRSLFVWPTSDHENIGVKLLYDDLKGFKSLCKDWREPSSKLKLLRLAEGFPEECVALLHTIESGALQDQPIWDMDPLSTYHFQRLVLMGDAAHPMPPYCGQRVAMALEDAVALGVLLEKNMKLEEIEDRFKLYSGTRSSRSAAVQQFVRGLSEADIWGGTSGFDASALRTYILGHDERLHMGRTLGVWKMQQAFQRGLAERDDRLSIQQKEIDGSGRKQLVSKSPTQPIVPQTGRSWLSRLKPPKWQSAITSS